VGEFMGVGGLLVTTFLAFPLG